MDNLVENRLIAEYKCPKCGKIEELSKEPLLKCPRCGSKLKRIYSPTNLKFKGKGFYGTDYKK